MRWIIAGAVIGLAGLLGGAAVAILVEEPARPAERPLELDSPEAVLDEAMAVVEAGRADRLADLIHAETPEMRAALDALGRLLGDLQDLGETLQSRFPEKVEALRSGGVDPGAAAGGSGFASMFGGLGTGAGNRRLAAALADPFGWLQRARGRLSVAPLTDDTAAVQVDGRPAFGVGLTMMRTEDGWRITPPLHVPPVSTYAPQSPEEWSILTSMILTVDAAVVDVQKSVRRGEARDLGDAARLAGEKAWAPLAMCVVAYQRVMELRAAGSR